MSAGGAGAAPVPKGDVINIAMHGALVPDFRAWLADRGLRLGRIPDSAGLDGEWWIVAPDPEVLERLRGYTDIVDDAARRAVREGRA